MKPMQFRSPSLIASFTIAFVIAVTSRTVPAYAEDLDFKELKTIQQQKKYGPYVGVFGGTTQSQDYELNIGGNPFVINPNNGGFVGGIEVGYSWKQKKFPLEIGLEFEGFFFATDLEGVIGPTPTTPITGGTVVATSTDMFAVAFMGNAWIGLDLWRYRARLGRFIAGWRPYVGAGVGGAQLWFREVVATTSSTVAGTIPLASPFESDEFVLAYQVFGGVEYRFNDRVALYAEYRRFTIEKTVDISNYVTNIWTAGLKLRY